MGQRHSNEGLSHQASVSSCNGNEEGKTNKEQLFEHFYDLDQFPPEVAVEILSKLNATDLCLASCVWKDLAENEVLWRRY